jgi:LysR family glycine cleavage system transcriptional activator
MTDEWLPPIQALRAFAATVRTGSFAAAAEELRLTAGAVSHHVARLEDIVGARLFERHRRGVTPTAEARQLAARLTRPLNEMRAAFAEARGSGRRALTVTMTNSFAQRWMLPRLSLFQAAHPDVDLRLRPTNEMLDLNRDGADLAIRYGAGRWPGLTVERLGDDVLFPVASPLYRNGNLPRDPAELADCKLIDNPLQPWRPWLIAAGLPPEGPTGVPIIDDPGLTLDLAARGHGIALARRSLVSSDLASGLLVKLFDIEVPDIHAYHLIVRSGLEKSAPVRKFAEWLKATWPG